MQFIMHILWLRRNFIKMHSVVPHPRGLWPWISRCVSLPGSRFSWRMTPCCSTSLWSLWMISSGRRTLASANLPCLHSCTGSWRNSQLLVAGFYLFPFFWFVYELPALFPTAKFSPLNSRGMQRAQIYKRKYEDWYGNSHWGGPRLLHWNLLPNSEHHKGIMMLLLSRLIALFWLIGTE
jgi:hypothetical protein